MNVIAVDNNPDDLKTLCQAIRTVHPDAEVTCFVDPMLAFKYSVSHIVDVLYTSVQMKRIGGFTLEKMVRAEHPGLITNYIADDARFKAKSIQNMANSYTVKPVTPEKLTASEAEEW